MTVQIVEAIAKLRMPAGVASARSLSELQGSLPSGARLSSIFKGDILLEDGAVLVPRSELGLECPTPEILIEPAAFQGLARVREENCRQLSPAADGSEWFHLADLKEPPLPGPLPGAGHFQSLRFRSNSY
jgi:hypothetical protein